MDAYFQEAVYPNLQQHDLMKYEWARYRTFQTFPKTSPLMPLRLAQAGFFYTGHDETVQCFCCNVSNGTWTSEETAMRVHRRLSPSCSFILGHSTPNVSIHGDTGSHVGENRSREESRRHLTLNETEHSEAPREALNAASNGSGNETNLAKMSSQNNKQPHEFSREFNCQPSESASISHHSGDIINSDRPKHPQYAIKIVRVSSFSGWPTHGLQTPEELATAGFFYFGFQDCVRCFHCGGALRKWEYGDSAWTEHARWYPGCGYVKRCKGDAFIASCRTAGLACRAAGPPVNMPAGTETQKTAEQSDRNDNNETLLDETQTRVLEMGYSQDRVEAAIHKYYELYGDTTIEFDLLLEVVENLEPSRGAPQHTDPTYRRRADDTIVPNSMDRKPSTASADAPRNACNNESDMPNSDVPSASNTREPINNRISSSASTDIAHTSVSMTNANRVINSEVTVTNATPELIVVTSDDKLSKDTANSVGGHTRGNGNPGPAALRNGSVSETKHNSTLATSRMHLDQKESPVKKLSKERQALQQENRRLREQMVCKVCLEAEACILFLPCGHLVCCQDCAPALRKCAVCRALVQGTVKIYTG